MSFVGSAVDGDQQARTTVTYTHGRTGTVDLAFTDWTIGGGRGGGTVQYGDEAVARAACRNAAGADRDRDPVVTYVFATKPLTAPEGRRIASVKLPRNADLHVFTLAVSRPARPPAPRRPPQRAAGRSNTAQHAQGTSHESVQVVKLAE